MTKLPVTAIVVFRNEKALLEECLKRLDWCSQIILVDMQSTDGSRFVAERYSSEIYEWEAAPIADPVRVWAARHARHEWIAIVDPDEHYPRKLVEDVARTLEEQPDAGGIRMPIVFHFKRRALDGTVWGGTHLTKLGILHKERGRILPTCNRISAVREGCKEIRIPFTGDNAIAHYWSSSYRDLLWKHLYRYPWRDAQRLVGDGVRFRARRLLTKPAGDLRRCLKDHDGWRLGLRGLGLSLVFGLYNLAIELCLLPVQMAAGRSVAAPEPDPQVCSATGRQTPLTRKRAA